MGQKILIVEDNEPIRENTIELLELFNYNVFTASNGKDGLDIALKEQPNLILSDIRMPVMDGYTLLKCVREQPVFNDTYFVFFTASSEKKEIEQGLQMGANDYIIKPFTGDELLGRLTKLLGNP